AARFGSAAAGISVTRPGAAPAMPHREEIDALLVAGHAPS
ncbi:MAG: ribokinase, partial [Alphaproteobacteria bacterium]|nr:ribokinase [Alphaproteobacteria bacterium]